MNYFDEIPEKIREVIAADNYTLEAEICTKQANDMARKVIKQLRLTTLIATKEAAPAGSDEYFIADDNVALALLALEAVRSGLKKALFAEHPDTLKIRTAIANATVGSGGDVQLSEKEVHELAKAALQWEPRGGLQ